MPNLIDPKQIERAEKNLLEGKLNPKSDSQKSKDLVFKSFQDSLKFFVQSVKHQDPMNPTDTTEMANQVFQLSQASGLHSMNEKLDTQNEILRSSQVLGIADLLGKKIELSSDKLRLEGGEKTEFSFTLPANLGKAKLEIIDQKNGVVFEKEYTPGPGQKTVEGGKQKVSWGGEINTSHGKTLNNGHPLKEGEYKLRIKIFDNKGELVNDPLTNEPVKVPTTIIAQLKGSDFSEKEPKLIVGDNQRLPLSSIVSIQENQQRNADRIDEFKDSYKELSKEHKREVRRKILDLEQQNAKKERLNSSINNLTSKQFERLKRQIEEQLNQR